MPFHLEVLQLDQWFLLLQPAHYLPHRPYDLMEEKETGSRHEVHEDDVNDYEIEHGE